MAKRNINSKKGFTIIEVVLVLAIAGLIFLMVFIALPALQRSQRDTQRRDDMARFSSQLSSYQANNNGKTPGNDYKTLTSKMKTEYTNFINNYLKAANDSFADPSTGSDYTIKDVTICTKTACKQMSSSSNLGEISVYTNATCEGESPKYVQGDRKIAFTLKLEGAGIYCGHN